MEKKTKLECELEELFEEWLKKQKSDIGYDWKNNGIAIDSFTKDGMVNGMRWDALKKSGRKKVLYILREANGDSSKVGECGINVDDGSFWFKDCVKNGKTGNKIFNRIIEMQKVIHDEQGCNKTDREKILEEVAYMNLNKRGGGPCVDWKTLNKYVEKYKDYIKREINILRPDIIVCCGTYWSLIDNVCGLYRTEKWGEGDDKDFVYKDAVIKDEAGNELRKVTIINMYHPSARVSNENYIDRFKKIYIELCGGENTKKDFCSMLKKDEICKIIGNMKENSEEYLELCDLISNIKESQEKQEEKNE